MKREADSRLAMWSAKRGPCLSLGHMLWLGASVSLSPFDKLLMLVAQLSEHSVDITQNIPELVASRSGAIQDSVLPALSMVNKKTSTG